MPYLDHDHVLFFIFSQKVAIILNRLVLKLDYTGGIRMLQLTLSN